MKSTFKKMTALFSVLLAGTLLTATAVAQPGSAQASSRQDNDGRLAEVAELEQQIHVTFHAAVSVHDPVNGDSPEVITRRIPTPSGDTTATGQQGTLCTFFKYVSGGMQIANKFVSLSPAYKTKYVPVKDNDGQWKSSVYFECHYFDVSLDPTTGLPLWAAKSHVDLDGEAKKIDGRWLLTKVSSSAVSVPVP